MKLNKKINFIIISFLLVGCGEFPNCFKDPCVDIPGNSRATPIQQTYAAASLFDSARYYVHGCKDMKVIDTHYEGISRYSWWEETWTIQACGTRWKNKIEFHPDGQVGGGIRLTQVK